MAMIVFLYRFFTCRREVVIKLGYGSCFRYNKLSDDSYEAVEVIYVLMFWR